MDRAIVGFRQDAEGHWVAELSCGHTRHVRHEPPFSNRPWTQDASGRTARIGVLLECLSCDLDDSSGDLEDGGDPACWAGSVCPACGRIVDPQRHECPQTGVR